MCMFLFFFALIYLIYPKCLPMVGMVVTISPSLSLYKMVVFPAASRPTVKYKKQSLHILVTGINNAQKLPGILHLHLRQ